MSTNVVTGEGQTTAPESHFDASAPPEDDAPPMYPSLAPMQPIVQYQPDPIAQEQKQLDMDISVKLNAIEQALTAQKMQLAAFSQTAVANTEQKKDLLQQLARLEAVIASVQINPNIQPKPQPKPQPQPQQLQHQAQYPSQVQVVTVVSDTWNTSFGHSSLLFNANTNSCQRTGGGSSFSTAFGNQVVNKGQYKKWQLRVLAKSIVKAKKSTGVDVVIGIVDSKKAGKGNEFWKTPLLGYGYYGWNGKKFHSKKQGVAYGAKFNVNDVVSIEINMHTFQLAFYVNNVSQGVAFTVDGRCSYIMAAALNNSDFELQIC